MEMDGLDSAKCQKLEKWDIMGITKIVNEEKDKDEQCSSSPKGQNVQEAAVAAGFVF